MAEVELREVASRRLGGRFAVEVGELQVPDGEILAVLGPSGSGKSTLLRLVAGLEPLAAGDILIGGRIVNDLPSHRRDLAFVAEDHALLDHLDVEGNIGFSLRLRHIPRSEARERVRSEARVFGLSRLLQRRPRTLSAGQRQAASVARATVRVPAAYLLDEPLSRMDARARERLRTELAGYVRGLGVTTLLATNDQSDAMAVADRVAVLCEGRLRQVGPPAEVHDAPADVFVATFLGDPGMNVLEGVLEAGARATMVRFGSRPLVLEGVSASIRRRFDGRPILLGLRPEELEIVGTEPPPGGASRVANAVPGVVERAEHLGAELRVTLRLEAPDAPRAVVRVRPAGSPPRRGARVEVAASPGRGHLFDPITEQALWHARRPSA